MTNKEKAREIAGGLNFPISGYETGAYDGALEMAKWKDEQFKARLENKLKSNAIPVIDELSIKTVTPVFIAIVRRHLLREIINELSEI